MLTGFSVLLALGSAAGLLWVGLRAPAKLAVRTVDQGLLALLVALAGGRAGYVAVNWGYFAAYPGEIGQVWLGGLSGVGAVYGFVLGLCLAARLGKENLGLLADRLLPLGMALGICAWLAAWWDGSAYGVPAAGWFALPALDERGLWARRFPTQALGAVLTLILWAGLDWLQRLRSAVPGRAVALGLLLCGLLLFGLAFTRADPAPLWRGWRLEAWAALGLAALGLLGWVFVEIRAAILRRKNGL